MRAAIHTALSNHLHSTFQHLTDTVGAALGESFDGSVMWYVTTVKLDLEARDEVVRHAGKPDTYTLA